MTFSLDCEAFYVLVCALLSSLICAFPIPNLFSPYWITESFLSTKFSLPGKLLCTLLLCLKHLFSSFCLSLASSSSFTLSFFALVWIKYLYSGLPLHAYTGFFICLLPVYSSTVLCVLERSYSFSSLCHLW